LKLYVCIFTSVYSLVLHGLNIAKNMCGHVSITDL